MTDRDDLRGVLGTAPRAFESVRGRFRLWQHHERMREARRANAQAFQSGPGRRTGGAERPAHPATPIETEVEVRIWQTGQCLRVEHREDAAIVSVDIKVGRRWWTWRKGRRELSGENSRWEQTSYFGESLLDPGRLGEAVRFSSVGRLTRAGRQAISVDATPRSHATFSPLRASMFELGDGADRYRLEVDADTGVLLAATAERAGQPFQVIEALEIEYDEPLDDRLFIFAPPAN